MSTLISLILHASDELEWASTGRSPSTDTATSGGSADGLSTARCTKALLPSTKASRCERRAFFNSSFSKILTTYLGSPDGSEFFFLRRRRVDSHLHSRLIGATIMNMIYGIKVSDKDDPYLTIAEEVVGYFVLGAPPGAFMVDYIPACTFVYHACI